MLKYLLDTNICIAVLKKKQPSVHQKFIIHAGEMAVSMITIEELQYGIEKGEQSRRLDKQYQVDCLLSGLKILDFDEPAAHHSADIRNRLHKGQQIGPFDNLIAGHARSKGLIIVTDNVREFQRVPGLIVENWIEH
ncbi:type II toxin-antitoxin system VapC family toxin [Endozoicomonas sp. Mp262]|uniref:type II toxin-antitoxin system VapC family toxin n=1 Tax=Endozoicomonas sp. Mp262 TaxID=2919499 RepID=UPI0021D7EBFC